MSAQPGSAGDAVRRRQEEFYREAEAARFEWLTRHPIISEAERTLLGRLTGLARVGSILEVGCGEGATLTTLRSLGCRAAYTGFDCFAEKIAFCRRSHPADRFIVADARSAFPFNAGTFDIVIVRDVLHHLADRERDHVLREAARTTAPGGTVAIVEGNARNVINAGYALLFPHERCMLETRVPRLQSLVARALPGASMNAMMEEPSNLFRFVLHYRFGVPALGRSAIVRGAFAAWSSLVRAVWPRRTWAYSIVELRMPADGLPATGTRTV